MVVIVVFSMHIVYTIVIIITCKLHFKNYYSYKLCLLFHFFDNLCAILFIPVILYVCYYAVKRLSRCSIISYNIHIIIKAYYWSHLTCFLIVGCVFRLVWQLLYLSILMLPTQFLFVCMYFEFIQLTVIIFLWGILLINLWLYVFPEQPIINY